MHVYVARVSRVTTPVERHLTPQAHLNHGLSWEVKVPHHHQLMIFVSPLMSKLQGEPLHCPPEKQRSNGGLTADG